KRPHAAAVVDEQPERDRDVVAPEQRNRLAFAVLVHGKRCLVEVGHLGAALVLHGGVEDDETCFGAKRGRCLLSRYVLERKQNGHHGGGTSDRHGFCDRPGASCTWIGVSA